MDGMSEAMQMPWLAGDAAVGEQEGRQQGEQHRGKQHHGGNEESDHRAAP
jgi:hypothetical protein